MSLIEEIEAQENTEIHVKCIHIDASSYGNDPIKLEDGFFFCIGYKRNSSVG